MLSSGLCGIGVGVARVCGYRPWSVLVVVLIFTMVVAIVVVAADVVADFLLCHSSS